jgi:hypothetical protein
VTLHRELLSQAYHLATKEPKNPRQASLRRAVSSAYYALFHLLLYEATHMLFPAKPIGLRERASRPSLMERQNQSARHGRKEMGSKDSRPIRSRMA